MLLVFRHFSVSGPLQTNLPSFPPRQTTLSTPSVPVGLGSFPEPVPSHAPSGLQPQQALAPKPAERSPVSGLIWVLPGEVLDVSFS